MTNKKREILRPTPPGGAELTPREKIIAQSPEEELGAGEGLEVEDGAPDGDAFPMGPGGSQVRTEPDGSLRPIRAEKLAVAWADGFRGAEAWEMTGGGAGSYRSRIETNEVFRERVGVLELEKKNLEREGVWGEACWAAKQNLRVARLGGVVMEIHKATVLYIETIKALSGVAPAPEGGSPDGEGEVSRAPGRPPNQPKALRVDVSLMREALVHKGLAPQPVAAE